MARKLGIFVNLLFYFMLSACGSGLQNASEGSNAKPSAREVKIFDISGQGLVAGAILFVDYVYYDSDNDPESGTTYQWKRNGAAIPNADQRVYLTGLLDAGTSLTVNVTPKAAKGVETGDTATADALPLADITPKLLVSSADKQLYFSWTPEATGKSYFRLSLNPDGTSGFAPVIELTRETQASIEVAVHQLDWAHAQYLLEACDDPEHCRSLGMVTPTDLAMAAVTYIKASNTDAGDGFGFPAKLSADGNTLAIGAPYEDSNAIGINGNQYNNQLIGDFGAVYVFTRNPGGGWQQQAYIKATNSGAPTTSGSPAEFGYSLDLSDDGNTLAVGARGDDSLGTDTGSVYVFVRNKGDWRQQQQLTASNPDAFDYFGIRVSLSGDGNTLAVGAHGEDSNASGVVSKDNPLLANNNITASGAVYLFTRLKGVWSESTILKASNNSSTDDTTSMDNFGFSVALSRDGKTLAVGAHGEDGSATTINGNDNDLSQDAGAVYIYSRTITPDSDAWFFQAYIKASNSESLDYFGISVALSETGDVLAVGAHGEDGGSSGIDGDRADNTVLSSGAIYTYVRQGVIWTAQSYIKSGVPTKSANLGYSVALSSDGTTLAAGAHGEDSQAIGLDGDQTDTQSTDSGAAYTFKFSNGAWLRQRYIKAPNTGDNDLFGYQLDISADGKTIAIGARGESSASVGVNGDMSDDTKPNSGAVYLY